MKTHVLVLACLLAMAARADVLSTGQQNVLTTVDTQATASQISAAFGSSAQVVSSLTSIVADPTQPPGSRVRAVQALVNYCTAPGGTCSADAQSALYAIVTSQAYLSARDGADLLVLRAAVEMLGSVPDVPPTLPDLVALENVLSHPSRDIRVSAARALRTLRNACAVQPLRNRFQQEPIDQVRAAISDALAQLVSDTATCPQ